MSNLRSILAILALQVGCAYQWQGKTYYTKSGAIEAQRRSLAAWLETVEPDQEPSLAPLAVVLPSEEEIRKEPLRAFMMDSWSVGIEALVDGLRRRNLFQSVEVVQEEMERGGDRAPGFVLRAVLLKAGFDLLLESASGPGVWVASSTMAVDDIDRFGVLLATIESLAKAGNPAKTDPALQELVRAEGAKEGDAGETARETDFIVTIGVGSGGVSGAVLDAEQELLNSVWFDGDPIPAPLDISYDLELVPWGFGAWSLGLRAGYSNPQIEETASYTDGGYSETYSAEFMSFHSVRGGAVLRRAVYGDLHAQLTVEAATALNGKITTNGLSAGFAGETASSAPFSGYGGRVGLGFGVIGRASPLVMVVEVYYDYLRLNMESRLYADVPRVSTFERFGFGYKIGTRF